MDIEKLSCEEIIPIQEKNIRESLEKVYDNSKFYRQLYKKSGFLPGDFKNLKDLHKIPMISRLDLQENRQDFPCEPKDAWIDICPTSGTSGESIYFPMTQKDLDFFTQLCYRGALGLGIDKADTVLSMLTLDNLLQPSKIMTHMFQFHLGALVLRAGPVGTERQISIMKELKPTAIFGIPTYLLTLGRSLKEYGFDPRKELHLKLAISTGDTIYHERWTPTELHKEVSDIWGAPYYSILGSTELNTGLWECPFRAGHHVHWDYYIPRIIDPVSGRDLPDGEKGELVWTLTGRDAAPLIRYRTGDITSLETSPCPCGRNSPRIMAIAGRTDQMLKIKGTAVFPLQIEETVLSVPGVSAYLIEIAIDENGMEQLKITINEPTERTAGLVSHKVKAATNITPEIISDSLESIQKKWYIENRVKPRKFWDKRTK